MLSTLSSVKLRLAIPDLDVTNDALLTTALVAISARFDSETNRILTRTVNSLQEFDTDDTEILPVCYPIESVSKFELKTSETEGWIEQTNVTYLIRSNCIVSLQSPLSTTGGLSRSGQPSTCRLTYTGGYVMPGTSPGAGQTALPSDLEQAALEQVAYWFQNRDKLGLLRHRPNQGTYIQLDKLDLLPGVTAVLKGHSRWAI